MKIHPTAIVDDGAHVEDGVEIGPCCHVGRSVSIGKGTRLLGFVSILGNTRIGCENTVYPYTVIGTPPQDISYKGEPTTVEIGDRNTIREMVTINAGTIKGGGKTIIGDNNLIMAACHVAHDCILEDNIIMANVVMLSGHVKVERDAYISGLTGVHHFVTIGRYSFIGGMSRITQDVPPYMVVEGNPPKVWKVNTVGLKRKGIPDRTIDLLKQAHKLIYREKISRKQAMEKMNEYLSSCEELRTFFDFLKQQEEGRMGRAREALRSNFS